MKILTVVGARPQFIKAAPVSRLLRQHCHEILVHTGQHYDANMSDVFFRELEIPRPDYQLGVGSGSHGAQTGAILEKIEQVIIEESPTAVLVYGDTNSTLAGALAAAKLHVPVLHMEAGLRSFNRLMPEEINRVLTDHISEMLFGPTDTAVANLEAEGIRERVYQIGDVMYDAFLFNAELAQRNSGILHKLGLDAKGYLLCTIHRAENTDNIKRLSAILSAITQSAQPVVLPLHPRTRKIIGENNLQAFIGKNVTITDPVGYLDMISLEQNALKILTDSGGVQKEAYFAEVPCITLRDETEWVETVAVGWNTLAGADTAKIIRAVEKFTPPPERPGVFGAGNAAALFVDAVLKHFQTASENTCYFLG
ncbi:UDP-N-acetylglucosamine 2-epimerase (non-hydrolyzing) [Paradesulfitobacterium aromaticivorans]